MSYTFGMTTTDAGQARKTPPTIGDVPREPRVSKTARIRADQARRLDAVLAREDVKKNITDAIEEGLDLWLAQYEAEDRGE